MASQLPPAAEVQILRIVQEALLNVERHAEATEAWITLSSTRGTVDLTVRDNGRGLASDANGGRESGQHGLRVMRERAGSIGGTLDITSGPGQGTEVRVSVPRGRYWK